ncbi:MAG: iron-containing alcohol dehydrogenase [Bacteroidetes bacterium]|nr:iron-containing alcohol dehydrogenase [Bacteroidota bacterium]
MENFTAYNPTVLHFGRNILTALSSTLKEYGTRVLFIYGKGSIKTSGLYDQIRSYLSQAGLEVCEYEGIKSNPLIEDVDMAAATGRANKVDVILAVGGGSVIDSAKVIAATIPVQHTGWNFLDGNAKPKLAVPIVAVLTLAATGSEMNPFAVITNTATRQKWAFGSPLTFPKHSFLDPSLTLTVPADYTAYGIADLIAHCFEAWFGIGDTSLTDRFVVSIVKEAMANGPALLNDLQNYKLREKIMFSATMALNGMTMYGRAGGEWGVHSIGHCLSFLYRVPHGASLTIVYPAWLKYFKNQIPIRISQLGSALFDSQLSADESILKIEEFFRSIKCPIRLSEAGIKGDVRQSIYENMAVNKVNGGTMKLKETDFYPLIDLFL